jgi:hypothetical protein
MPKESGLNPFKKVTNKVMEKAGFYAPFKEADPEADKKEKMIKEITEWVKTKQREWGGRAFNPEPNPHMRPYARGFSYVDLGEALRELGIGETNRLENIFDQMIKNAIDIDPTWPDIKEMRKLKSYLDEINSINQKQKK